MPRWYITAVSFTMKKYLFVLSALVLFAFSSCKKFAGDPITKEFTIDGTYTELEVCDAFDVTVSDAVDVITITAGENVMPYVIVEKVENTLKIYIKPVATFYGGDLKAVIPYNAGLTGVYLSGASEFHSVYGLMGRAVEVELSGASEFYCDIDADEIDMNLSGSSYIEGNVDASNLVLDMSGASDATLRGQVTTLDLGLSGASSIKKTITGSRYGLECDVCKGEISGASDAYIHCNLIIKVDLSGSSELHFTGEGNPAESSVSGGSEIIYDVLP